MTGLVPYILGAYMYKSPPMFLIFILGTLFHRYPNSKTLYFLDSAANTTLLLIGTTQNTKTSIVCSFVIVFYTLNTMIFPTKYNRKWENIRHVIFVQIMGAYSFYELREYQQCKKYVFICNNYN